MELQLSIYQLGNLLKEAARMGSRFTLSSVGKLKPYLNKNEAFKIYGRKNVESWIEQGLITARKDGDHSCPWRIEWLEIECVARAKQLIRFL